MPGLCGIEKLFVEVDERTLKCKETSQRYFLSLPESNIREI
jgi:hypothetical protein